MHWCQVRRACNIVPVQVKERQSSLVFQKISQCSASMCDVIFLQSRKHELSRGHPSPATELRKDHGRQDKHQALLKDSTNLACDHGDDNTQATTDDGQTMDHKQ